MNINIESGYLNISINDKSILKAEFDELESVEQRFNFWHNKFGLNYSLNYFDNIQIQTFTEFIINPTNRNEIEYLNKRNFDEWLKYDPNFGHETIITAWKEDFESEIESVSNKAKFIAYEIRRIDDYILGQNEPKKLFKNRFIVPSRNEFIDCYENYLKFEEEIDWGKKVYQPFNLNEKLKGIECAKYREYLHGYLEKETPKKDEFIKLTGEQKFLILHYLGFGIDIETKINKAVLFDLFINELNSNTIRPMFSDIKKYETVDNLNKIIDFFRLINIDVR